jgi:CRISPR-associated endonuclease/helicase Cas3
MARWSPPGDTTFKALFPKSGGPRPIQEVVERLTKDLQEPALLLIEAPTGEGKSKAALQAASAMVRQLGMAGFYVGMPTQATGNQMLGEIERMLKALGDTTPVSLVHSTARDFLAERATAPTEISRDEDGGQDVAAATWFTRKRNLLGALGVGTVDQALKGAIRSGHVFVRLAALSGKVVVIDEVHAYDVYMSTLLERLLMWLGALGTPVILLSATLPSGRRHALVAAWQAGLRGCTMREIPALPASPDYPRITVADANGTAVHPAGISRVNKDRTIHLKFISDEKVVDWLLEHALAGRSVAVIHNLVKRAIATYEELEERLAELPPDKRPKLIAINGPLLPGLRREVEADLQAYFGEKGTKPTAGAIVVGTQVLEQSLDLDFDAILSDLAPIDSLIQRAGRVHRHDRAKSRGEQTLTITGVTDTPAGPEFPLYLRNVYAPIVLLRTWALIRNKDYFKSPREIPGLIDAVYEERVECPPGWEAMWLKGLEHGEKLRQKDRYTAATVYLPQPQALDPLSDLTARSRKSRSAGTRKKRRNR